MSDISVINHFSIVSFIVLLFFDSLVLHILLEKPLDRADIICQKCR